MLGFDGRVSGSWARFSIRKVWQTLVRAKGMRLSLQWGTSVPSLCWAASWATELVPFLMVVFKVFLRDQGPLNTTEKALIHLEQ